MKRKLFLSITLLVSIGLSAQIANSSGNLYCSSQNKFDLSFTYTVDSSNTVKFTNTSKPLSAYTYSWRLDYSSFRDSSLNPTYQYSSPNTYRIELIAVDSANNSCTLSDTISVNKCLASLFVINVFPDGLVKYSASSQGTPADSIHWSFGDGTQLANYLISPQTSYSKIHQYLDTGKYQAIVSITDVLQNTCKDTTNISLPCFASFDYVLDSSNTISFTNTSLADSNATYSWDYYSNPKPADTSFNASFQLSEPDTFYPTLSISSPSGSCQVSDTISVNMLSKLNWKIDQNKLKVSALSYRTKIDSISVNFGDGKSTSVFQKSEGQPSSVYNYYHYSHQYDTSGTYEVTSTFTNEFGVTFSDTITVKFQDCFAGFSKALDSTKTKVILANTSSAEAGSVYHYSFGDGTSKYNQSSKSISHTYAKYGTYEVCVTVENNSNGQRCYSTFCDSVGLDSLGNLNNYSFNKSQGFTINFVDSTAVLVGVKELLLTETKSLSEINVYPNPSNAVFNIDLMGMEAAVNIMLFNTLGEVVFLKKYNANQKVQVDLSNYKKGFYYLVLSNDQEKITKKLLKF